MFNLNTLLTTIKIENPSFSRFTRSSLSNLIEYLGSNPNPSPNYVWKQVRQIPNDKWVKYQKSLNYLLECFPGSVVLDVPFVSQHNIGGTINPDGTYQQTKRSWNDATGCWYASACMVGYYFGSGPRMGLPELFKVVNSGGVGQTGHFATGSGDAIAQLRDHHRILAMREQLKPVTLADTYYEFTYYDINKLLRENGPIFFYWQKISYGHASVIIGVDNEEIVFHDPENAPNSRMAISDYNKHRQNWRYAMMQRDK